MNKETKFELLTVERFIGWMLGNILIVGVSTISLCSYSFLRSSNGSAGSIGRLPSVTEAQAEERSEALAPNVVISAKEKHILDMAIQLCKEGGVSNKGMGPCVERESKDLGLK